MLKDGGDPLIRGAGGSRMLQGNSPEKAGTGMEGGGGIQGWGRGLDDGAWLWAQRSCSHRKWL